MFYVQGLLGMAVLLLIAFALSEKRKNISWKLVASGISLQLLIALLLFKIPPLRYLFTLVNKFINLLLDATHSGTAVLFGYLGGGDTPFTVTQPQNGFILAIQSFPLVLLISALSAVCFHMGITQKVVKLFSKILAKTMNVDGAEGVGVSVNIFIGMVESPLIVRRYISSLSRSALFTIMTTGMATIAGTMLGLYATFLKSILNESATHLLIASIISAPASIVIAKIMLPEERERKPEKISMPSPYANFMDALTQGTGDGLKLLLNIVAMMIVLLACVFLINAGLGLLPQVNGEPLSLVRIVGWIFSPLAWLMGIPWAEAPVAGDLLGTKLILNELIAYLKMGGLSEGSLSSRSVVILTYALCGFANPGSVGIMIGGISAMAPERTAEIAALGFKSMFAGFLACCMTAIIAGWFA